MWGLSPSDGDAAINAYKIAHGITNPCAGTNGGGPDAIDLIIEGQNFLGYPTYCVVCPDKSLYFDVCYPPSVACFDPYIEDCGFAAMTANFTSDATEVCQYDVVSFEDMSVGDITSWNWTFEGGDPATSTEQNPLVTYNDEGSFDVELEVSDGTNSNSLIIPNYISVEMTPPTMLLPFDDACITDPPFELSGGSPAGGSYSGPGVGNGWFDPATAGLGLHTITYTYTAANGCDNSAEETLLVDECTGIGESGEKLFRIFPNPSTGTFEVEVNCTGEVYIQVYNMLGMKISRFSYTSNGSIQQHIDLGDHESGIYFVSVSTPDETLVKKVKLLKR
jgi:PKD repeat protein